MAADWQTTSITAVQNPYLSFPASTCNAGYNLAPLSSFYKVAGNVLPLAVAAASESPVSDSLASSRTFR